MDRLLARKSSREQFLSFRDLVIDLRENRAVLGGQELSLGRKEFGILALLVRKGGEVVTREEILSLYPDSLETFDRTVDSHLSHLRKNPGYRRGPSPDPSCLRGRLPPRNSPRTMSPSLLLRLLGFSLALSLILEIVILFGIRHLNEEGEGPLHNHALHIMARMVENGHDTAVSLTRLEQMRRDLGLRPVDAWIVNGNAQPLATFPPGRPLPLSWRRFPKPDGIHRMAAHYLFFHLFPDYLVLRLDRPQPLYLLLRESPSAAHKRKREGRVLFLFATMATSAFSGLLLTFLVFRQKSREAKKVISALAWGELKARFPISRINLIGSLMTDFNRMAQSIEELVGRIEENDRSRRDLLQELGHDLRTPLTSLRTAADTLVSHGAAMAPKEHDRFARIIRAERPVLSPNDRRSFLHCRNGNPPVPNLIRRGEPRGRS